MNNTEPKFLNLTSNLKYFGMEGVIQLKCSKLYSHTKPRKPIIILNTPLVDTTNTKQMLILSGLHSTAISIQVGWSVLVA